jgi:hypothetical protein
MIRTRIITFNAYPRIGSTPKVMLLQGSRCLTIAEKKRVFCVRAVEFNEINIPQYSIPRIGEQRYENLLKLYNDYPLLEDIDILDNEHRLQTWKEN